MIVRIPYKPRPLWAGAKGIHRCLDKHRFSVLVAHRRFGKTFGIVNQLIKRALVFQGVDGRFGYVAPFRNQAKSIAWNYLKRYTAVVPDVRYNEGELAVYLPNGAHIRLFGADNADALRGLYFDGLVVDEVADIKPEVWGEVLRPTLADREGWCIFIGTPKGQNLFFELYEHALVNDRWYAGMFRADETNVLPEGELAVLREEMSDNQFRQEMLCDFSATVDNALIGLDDVLAAEKRSFQKGDIVHAATVMGLDVARFGDDESVLTRRQGLVCFEQKVYRKKDNMTLAALVASELDRYKPDALFVDAGRGEGVIDRLRQLGFEVIEVNFGGKAIDKRFYNKRSEMWGLCAEWVKCGQLPACPRLRQELTLPTYGFDVANRLRLEGRDKMKERVGFSPDRADSLVLTFAMPVVKRSIYGAGSNMCKTDYSFF